MLKHINGTRASIVSSLTFLGVMLTGGLAHADTTSDVTSEITGLSADLGTYAVALVGLIAIAVGIGFGIRFLLKAKRAASGV